MILKPLSKKSNTIHTNSSFQNFSSNAHAVTISKHRAAIRIQSTYRQYKSKFIIKIKRSLKYQKNNHYSTRDVVTISRHGYKKGNPSKTRKETIKKDITFASAIGFASLLKQTVSAHQQHHYTIHHSYEDIFLSEKGKVYVHSEKEERKMTFKDNFNEKEDHTIFATVLPSSSPLSYNGYTNMLSKHWLVCTPLQRRNYSSSSMPLKSTSLVFKCVDYIKHSFSDLIFIFSHGKQSILNLKGQMILSSSKAIHQQITLYLNSVNSYCQNEMKKIYSQLKTDLSLPCIRLFGWILSKLFRLLFDGMYLHDASIQELCQVVLNCPENTGICFLPTHKSHLDYLILSYLTFAYGLPMPRIIAGNNLNLPMVGNFLQSNGSLFIPRSFQHHSLHKIILKQYLYHLVHQHLPLEMFIEGQRSRTGFVNPAKLGILSMLKDVISTSETIQDIILIPIAIDYDRVLEDESYASYRMGHSKKPESVFGLIQSIWDLLFRKCGNVYVHVGQKISMKEYIVNKPNNHLLDKSHPSFSSSSIQCLADQIHKKMQSCCTMTITCLLSSYFLSFRNQSLHDINEISCFVSTCIEYLAVCSSSEFIMESTSLDLFHGFKVLQPILNHQLHHSPTLSVLDDQIQSSPPLDEQKDGTNNLFTSLNPPFHSSKEDRNNKAILVELGWKTKEQKLKGLLKLTYYRNQLINRLMPSALMIYCCNGYKWNQSRKYDMLYLYHRLKRLGKLFSCEFEENEQKLSKLYDDITDLYGKKTGKEKNMWTTFMISLVQPFIDSLYIVLKSYQNLSLGDLKSEKELNLYVCHISDELLNDEKIEYVESCCRETIKLVIRFTLHDECLLMKIQDKQSNDSSVIYYYTHWREESHSDDVVKWINVLAPYTTLSSSFS